MTNSNKRRQLYNRLIVKDNKPCATCRSLIDRRIHRVIPGCLDGKYTLKNVRVLCESCHLALHNQSKFKLGTKVTINGRCPKYILGGIRHNRARTITSVFYNDKLQANLYYLGGNNRGSSDFVMAYPFRSYQLKVLSGKGVGRPRTKRVYTLHSKCTEASQDRQAAMQRDEAIQLDVVRLNIQLVKR